MQHNPPHYQAIISANTSISIDTLSPKQLLGECIDIAAEMLKQLIETLAKNFKDDNPLANGQVRFLIVKKPDFSALVNYVLDPAKFETILEQCLTSQEISVKALVKTWVFELKNLRNCWAHSNAIDMRLALRGFQTLSLLFRALNGSEQSEMYRKIQTYRKTLTIFMTQRMIQSP